MRNVSSLPDKDNHVGLFLGHVNLLLEEPNAVRPYFKDRIALAMNPLEGDDVLNDLEVWEILTNTLSTPAMKSMARLRSILRKL
jgi:hypothetical protein